MNIHHQLTNVVELLVRDSIKKWCLFISFNNRSEKENLEEQIEEDESRIKKYCRFLSKLQDKENEQKIKLALQLDSWILIECQNEKECKTFYEDVDGDDTGGCMYAATIDPTGQWRNENT